MILRDGSGHANLNKKKSLTATGWLSFGAIGVVFGDIGTSPLYTLHEALGLNGNIPEPVAVLGVLSLIFWSLVLIVSIKYVTFVMRADNRGEGGVMALMALAKRSVGGSKKARWILSILGIFGASLFYGDSTITPAISVLGAVEGVEIAMPSLDSLILLIAVVVVAGLFAIQKYGSQTISKAFAPIMLVWFLTIGILGAVQIVQAPSVLTAANPWYAIYFLMNHGLESFIILGGVVLALTGAEALYADMGHFGRNPIRLAWFALVLPCLMLNYFGQGALLLAHPELISNPFYNLVSGAWIYPLIILATMAAVIASQSVITGAYSMTREAMLLGYLPRLKVVHTSNKISGQIYLPWANGMLFVLVVCAILGFQSSANLGAAYGIAVTGTMTVTSLLVLVVARKRWHWRLPAVVLAGCVLLTIDLSFLVANILKIANGGWFPLVLGIGIFVIMSTWYSGRILVNKALRRKGLPLDKFILDMQELPPTRVSGTAVFLTNNKDRVSHALLNNIKHNKVLHERNILLSIKTLETPYSSDNNHIDILDKGFGFYEVELRFGFMEVPDVPKVLAKCTKYDLVIDMNDTTFFLSRETVLSETHRYGMPLWRYKLFSFLARNSMPATDSFKIPGDRRVKMGTEAYV